MIGEFALEKIFIILLIFICFLLIIRELVLWYFKINERVEILKSIKKRLDQFYSHLYPEEDEEET